jgi:hypothetical protein
MLVFFFFDGEVEVWSYCVELVEDGVYVSEFGIIYYQDVIYIPEISANVVLV